MIIGLRSWISKERAGVLRSLELAFLLLTGLSACVTNPRIRNVPFSFNAIKTVVKSQLPGGTRRESDNGRTMTSAFFDPETLKPEVKLLKQHAYMTVVVLGSSRPYDIDVHVFKEERRGDGDGYDELGEDDVLTDKLGERLRAALADRREDRNVIDDFRVF